MMPVIAPCRSGDVHTMPSAQAAASRNSTTLGWVSGTLSGKGSPAGSKMRTSPPKACSKRAASKVSSRL